MKVFEWLHNFFESNKQIFADKKVEFSFSPLLGEETDKPAQYVDIDTEMRMARVTLWETGECDFEIIENETGKQIYWENRIAKSEMELSGFLIEGFSKL